MTAASHTFLSRIVALSNCSNSAAHAGAVIVSGSYRGKSAAMNAAGTSVPRKAPVNDHVITLGHDQAVLIAKRVR